MHSLRRIGGGLCLVLGATAGAACSGNEPDNGLGQGTTDSTGSSTDGTGSDGVGAGTSTTGSTTGSDVGTGGLNGSGSGGSGGSGASGNSNSGGAGNQTGGNSGSGASDGSGGAPEDDGPAAAPEGSIPNDSYPEDVANPSQNNWRDGLISPTLEFEHHNQPSIINGYLQINGNSRFSIYDISDPTDPQQLSHVLSPDDCTPCGEAEGHQVSFAKYGDKFYSVTIQGKGVDLWDITDVTDPKHVKSVYIQGVNYGDFTEAVWGVAWQGSYIFVGGTNTGVHVIDATDPSQAELVAKVTNLGGVLAGPVFPVGNTLVVTTPKDNAGIATLDISDPENPVVLKTTTSTQVSYIGGFYRHHAYLLNPLRVYDVLSDPVNFQLVNGNRPGGYFEYVSFQDDKMFAGHIRPNPGATKIDVSDISNFRTEKTIYGRRDLSENDDQFTVAVGNLLILSDDQLSPATNKYAGTVIAVHDTQPDTTPPEVDTIIPRDGASGVATTSRIGISFSDNVELATVDHRSFIVRKVGSTEALRGTYGVNMSVLHFDPEGEFEPATEYEVVLPAGGVKDYVANGIAQEFRSTFTTK